MGAGSLKVLAFDCSTARGSLAFVQNEIVVFSETFDCPRGRGGMFFEVLERAIAAAGRPDRVAVGIGPGSYNGLRTTIAAGEGLRLAMGVDLVGVSSVRCLPTESGEYVAVNDARGGVFYYVRVRNREIAGDFELLEADVLSARLAGEPEVPVFASAPVAAVDRARVVFPDAVILAGLAAGGESAVGGLEPLYLKPAHITQPKRTGLLPRAN